MPQTVSSVMVAGGEPGRLLALLDPVIFGQIIDRYATPPFTMSANERVRGAPGLMALAVAIALGSRLARMLR